jgi:hypothetical protein
MDLPTVFVGPSRSGISKVGSSPTSAPLQHEFNESVLHCKLRTVPLGGLVPQFDMCPAGNGCEGLMATNGLCSTQDVLQILVVNLLIYSRITLLAHRAFPLIPVYLAFSKNINVSVHSELFLAST